DLIGLHRDLIGLQDDVMGRQEACGRLWAVFAADCRKVWQCRIRFAKFPLQTSRFLWYASCPLEMI
ncbi:MAG: hypothetical protein P1U77_11875, partial [Rubripirellula sp.]|nr:hypothetical protein [Rubripirellula sp.]